MGGRSQGGQEHREVDELRHGGCRSTNARGLGNTGGLQVGAQELNRSGLDRGQDDTTRKKFMMCES